MLDKIKIWRYAIPQDFYNIMTYSVVTQLHDDLVGGYYLIVHHTLFEMHSYKYRHINTLAREQVREDVEKYWSNHVC